MIFSAVMSPRKKNFDKEPIEPEVLDPSEEEIAEINPPPEVPHPIAPENHHATDITAVVPVTALQQYLAEVRLHPYLSKEEELRLFHEYKVQGSRDAAVKLIMANLRVSISIAAEYLHTGADHMDLIQEGNVGLMHAIKKFDPSKNVRFYAYAAWWSRAYILRYLLNNYRLVKIGTTQDQRKLFYNLKKEKAKLEREGFSPDTKLLADRLNVRERDVIEMGQRLGNWELSLDQPIVVQQITKDIGPRPPGGIGIKTHILRRVELFNSMHQPDIAFLNEVHVVGAGVEIFGGNRDGYSQVGHDEFHCGIATALDFIFMK
jgi:RNA polymerase sigma-32 factor